MHFDGVSAEVEEIPTTFVAFQNDVFPFGTNDARLMERDKAFAKTPPRDGLGKAVVARIGKDLGQGVR